MRKSPVRIVALIILIANVVPLITLGTGIALSVFLYGAAGLMLAIVTKRGDVRICLALSVFSFISGITLVEFGPSGPLCLLGGLLLWIEALRRQASVTDGSRAAIHYRSVQGLILALSFSLVPILWVTGHTAKAWLISITAGIGLIVGIYLVLASYCWFAELKPGATLTDEFTDQLSL